MAKDNLMELLCTHRHGTYNLATHQRIGPENQRAVGNMVRKVCNKVLEEVLGVSKSIRSKACLAKVSKEKCLYKILAKHDDIEIEQFQY